MRLSIDDIIETLVASERFFVRFSEEQYVHMVQEDAWGHLLRTSKTLLRDTELQDEISRLVAPPSFEVMKRTQNNLFTGGMPLASLPVESLHSVWSESGKGPFGRARGLYQADRARHIQAVYDTMGIEIPSEFAATPDHITLLLELVVLFLEAGNMSAALQVVDDHLLWLDSYALLLLDRAREASNIEGYSQIYCSDLEKGILFYQSLVTVVSLVFQEMRRVSENSKSITSGYRNMRTKEVVHG